MPVRNADAAWEGNLKEGAGRLRLGSGAFEGQYSFDSRFENGTGTNPEELIGAAHAGCYSMALANEAAKAGFSPQNISTTAEVHLRQVGDGFEIGRIDLRCEADIAAIDNESFQKLAQTTKDNCPVSKLVASSAEIVLEAKLSG